jgi:RNA polymerase sigma-70 factor (ECF subfamily)
MNSATRVTERFEQIALRELPVLYRVARRLTLDDSEAEDLVGQSLLLAAKAWNSFDGRFARSWLIRILKNEHLATRRRKASKPEAALDDVDEPSDEGFWEEVSWRAVGSQVMAELDKLPAEYRMAVALCDVEQLSYEEAAAAMDVPIGTVRSRLFRGRKLLRAKLAHVVEGDSHSIGEQR